MHLPSFDYRSARTVEEAVALHAGAAGAAYMAGATDLLPQARTGRRTLARVIDVKTIPALRAFADDQGGLRIGAAVPLSDVAADPRVRERWPLLAQCCLAVGAWPLRNRATLAGNVCNASPAADTAVALLALDAIVVAEGPDGSRELPIDGFFVGPGRSALAPGELVTAIRLTAASAGLKGSYLRLSRRKGLDLATVGVLVGRRGVSGSANGSANGGANGGANGSANGGGNGSASGSANGGGNGSANGSANGGANGGVEHRVALAAVAPTPLRVTAAEARLDAGDPAGAAEAARAAASPITDLRGTAGYRREMVGVLAARAAAALHEAVR